MFFSFSQLYKVPATVLFTLSKSKRKRFVSEQQYEGNKFAESQSKSKYKEMSIKFKHKDITIYASVDEIVVTHNSITFVEYKNFNVSKTENARDAIYQLACIYSLFLYRSIPELRTSTFYAKGSKKEVIDKFPEKLLLKVVFNNTAWYVRVTDPLMVVRFLLTKARATLSLSTAYKFDKKYLYNEGEFFEKYVTYKPIANHRISHKGD